MAEIERRIALDEQAFLKKNKGLTKVHVILKVIHVDENIYLGCYLLYTKLKTRFFVKRQRFSVDMWMWRRVTMTSWIQWKENLLRIKREGEKFHQSLLRHNEFETNIIECKVHDRRQEWLEDFNHFLQINKY